MLKKILKEDVCAKCRICCSFVESDSWETPVFTSDNIVYDKNFKEYGKYHTLNFHFKDDKQILLCPKLDENTGCVLNDEDKPFDCKIWPLRIMKMNDKIVLALAKVCNELKIEKKEKIIEILDEGLRNEILKRIEDEDMVKEYDSSYDIIEVLL